MRRRKLWTGRLAGAIAGGLLCGGLILAPARPAAAAPANISIRFESELWSLNGDAVRQPNVPLSQKLVVPSFTLSDSVDLQPGPVGATRGTIPANIGQPPEVVLEISKTTQGATYLVPNPTNRFDPFTGRLQIRFGNDPGTAMFDPTGGGWSGETAVNFQTRIILDEVAAGGEFFVANIDLVGAIGLANSQKTFTGKVELLDIPIEGTLFGDRFTSGRKTVMATLITRRRNGDPAGTPTGFRRFTFTSTGEVAGTRLVLITPIVTNAFAGLGPNRIPIPLIGFTRSIIRGPGVTFAPEPGAVALAAGLLLTLGLRRRAARRASTRAD